MKKQLFMFAGVVAASLFAGTMASASADLSSPRVAGKPLPWPAASQAARAAPEKFFPLVPAAHARAPARGIAHDFVPEKPFPSAADGSMTEEQARQLLSVYPVHP